MIVGVLVDGVYMFFDVLETFFHEICEVRNSVLKSLTVDVHVREFDNQVFVSDQKN